MAFPPSWRKLRRNRSFENSICGSRARARNLFRYGVFASTAAEKTNSSYLNWSGGDRRRDCSLSQSHNFSRCVVLVTACDDENLILRRHNGSQPEDGGFGTTDQDASCLNINRYLQRILRPSSVPAARTAGRIACCCRSMRWDAPAVAPAPSNAANAVAFKPSSDLMTRCGRTRRAGSPVSSNRRRKLQAAHQTVSSHRNRGGEVAVLTGIRGFGRVCPNGDSGIRRRIDRPAIDRKEHLSRCEFSAPMTTAFMPPA
jgi:hypothetical protein